MKTVNEEIKKPTSKIGLIFGKYLLLTNTVSSGILMFLGESLAQKLKSKDDQIDFDTVKQMTVVGISQGPLHHFIYHWVERFLPGTSMKMIMGKILTDQALISPLCIGHYFYAAGLLEGKTVTECTKTVESKFFTVYIADWCIWPIAQFFNFYYVPLQYRVLYINAITMFYNVFLCYVKNQKEIEIEQPNDQTTLKESKE
ncbi:unnamed protein product [Diamesa serratosioi]